MNVKKIGFLVVVLLLVACMPTANVINKKDAQLAIDNMVYVKDSRTGLCFGVISSMPPGGSGSSTSMSVTQVPCDKVQDQLK